MERFKRKIDAYLLEWKESKYKMPLIVSGARQIGKTNAIRNFGTQNYKYFIEINFIEENFYKDIFDEGYKVDNILKRILYHSPLLNYEPGETLIFFDEIQKCPNCATSLKFFREDGRFDVICSGSLMGLNYKEIESTSVGNKTDYIMRSMDFEEFLWAKGYTDKQIDDIYSYMKELKPLPESLYNIFLNLFKEYIVVGGMPLVVKNFIEEGTYKNVLTLQRQILLDYEEDITKYAGGLDKAKILNVYRKIPAFLGEENKRFQITKIAVNAKNRDYIGVVEWLKNAGIINICYQLTNLSLPLKGNYNPSQYKLYFGDSGLLIASLDDESQTDLRENNNFNTCKGAIYENIVADMLASSNYELFYYRNTKSTIEMDFFIRDNNSLVPVEVKANDNSTPSLNKLIDKSTYKDIKYGIKLCNKNIGFNEKFYTFPYFLTFLLKRYITETKNGNNE